MVSSSEHISGVRISSVVPAHVTGEHVVHELSGLDLAMRLHYIKAVYFFTKDDVGDGLNIYELKKPMFWLLDAYFPVAGRIRQSDSGAPFFIKCNDGGVRIVEAKCAKTLDEWLKMEEPSINRKLVSQQTIGQQIGFSPLVFIQFTKFACGGLSVGLTWSHVLGDAFSACDFINTWCQMLAGDSPSIPPPHLSKPGTAVVKPLKPSLLAVKPVTTVDGKWEMDVGTAMEHLSFRVNGTQLKQLRSRVGGQFSNFDAVAAIAWKATAKARGNGSVGRAIVVKEDRESEDRPILGNWRQVVRVVGVGLDAAGAELRELVRAVAEEGTDGRREIEGWMEREGYPEVQMYGGNLTLVDMEGAAFHGLKVEGRKPVFVDLFVGGVGKEGTVILLPGHEPGGRVVSVCMPADQIESVVHTIKTELGV